MKRKARLRAFGNSKIVIDGIDVLVCWATDEGQPVIAKDIAGENVCYVLSTPNMDLILC